MNSLLMYLHGKKAWIISIAGLVLQFVQSEGIISGNLAVLLSGILVIIGGGADMATNKILSVSIKNHK